MRHRSLRCSTLLVLVLAAACGGGDFVSKNGGKGDLDGKPDASTGGRTGSGGTQSGGGSGTSSSSGGSVDSGGSATSGGTAGTGGRQGSGIPDASAGGSDTGGDGGTISSGGSAGANTGGAGGGTANGGTANGGTANGGTANGGTASGGTASGGTASGGTAGSPDCTDPMDWYVDSDQDGYGSSTTPPKSSCIQPPGHFTKVGGDCDDSNDMVHPQLTPPELKYFSTPYQTPGGTDSFDYDCSGMEEGDPGQTKAASSCPALTLGACGGSGYRPVSTGNRVAANGYCGSKTYRTCVSTAGVTCSAQDNSNFSEAYRCK